MVPAVSSATLLFDQLTRAFLSEKNAKRLKFVSGGALSHRCGVLRRALLLAMRAALRLLALVSCASALAPPRFATVRAGGQAHRLRCAGRAVRRDGRLAGAPQPVEGACIYACHDATMPCSP